MMAYRYYTMDQRGGLKEAVETMKEITEEQFKKEFYNGNYKYYGYDSRIECLRFISGRDSGPFYLIISSCCLATIKELTKRQYGSYN